MPANSLFLGKIILNLTSTSLCVIVLLIDWHLVSSLYGPDALLKRPFLPHKIKSVQGSTVPLLNFQLAHKWLPDPHFLMSSNYTLVNLVTWNWVVCTNFNFLFCCRFTTYLPPSVGVFLYFCFEFCFWEDVRLVWHVITIYVHCVELPALCPAIGIVNCVKVLGNWKKAFEVL